MFCFDFPILQVVGMSALTLITVTFMLYNDIFADRRRLFTEAFNEVSLLSVNALMMYALIYDDTDE